MSRIELEDYVGKVYDFTIPGDRTFWANGILVHNCGPCEEINGTVFGYTDDPAAVAAALAAYPMGGYVHCEGRERCRGTLTALYETPAEPQNHDATVLSMLRRVAALLDAPETAPINGHEHHEARV